MPTSTHLNANALTADDTGASLKVLILDDMETDRMRLKRLCRKAGLTFEAVEADTVARFRACLERRAFDIVFIDYQLGIETGLDALAALKAHEAQAHAVAIMVSSMQDLDIAIDAMRQGCADYINKEELSVEAIRKSITLAFERRLLMFSLSAAQAAEHDMRTLVTRISRTCGDEIRQVIAATLQHVQAIDGDLVKGGGDLAQSLTQLDRLCSSLGDMLVALEDDAKPAVAAQPRPRPIERRPR